MCKKLLRLLTTVLILGIASISCNETFAPEVYFGNKNYVNDYSALAEQVKTISDRIDLLNKILDENFEGIRISIDDNTRAINAQTEKMSDDLGSVVANLFNGFSELSCKIRSMGEQIVYAINEQGEIIALRIKENGVLVSTSIEANAADLLKAINSGFGSLASRFEALNEAIKVGLASIEVKVTLPGEDLLLEFKNISEALKGIDLTLIKGFTALNATQDGIIFAINEKGDILKAAIDEHGQLIEAAIVAQTRDLVKTINSASATLAERLGALGIAIDSGLATIRISSVAEGDYLSTTIISINELLKGLTTTLFDDFKMLSNTMLENGYQLIKAINSNGDKIALTINANGRLIAAGIDDIVESLNELKAILESADKTLEEKLDALTSAICCGVKGISCSLDKQTNTLSLKLGEVQCTLFQGFSTISTKLCENNCTLMYALDKAGQLISVSINQNGELLAAKFQCTAKQIVEALNKRNGSLEDKISALCTAVESGLANVNVTLGDIGGMLNMEFSSLNEAVKGIKDGVLEGFKLTGKYMLRNGNIIARAIADNGDKIAISIDKNGKLLEVKLADVITSINDLAAALADDNEQLNAKFNMLNKAIADGFEGISAAFNNSTKKITLKLGDIQSTLFDGFEGLKKVITTEGDGIIYAVNTNGEVIAAKIKENGDLVSAAIAGNTGDIVKAINDQTTGLRDCIDYLNFMVQTGLAGIEVKIGDVGGMLDIRLTDINKTLKGLKSGVLEGFSLLGTEIGADNQTIVDAINGLGEKISLTINEKGELIHIDLGNIAEGLRDLIAYLENADNGIADKIDALNKAIADKIAEVTAAITGETGLISAALGNVSLSFLNGFTSLSQQFDDLGNVIASAINKQGEGIILKIDEKGNLINASIELGADAIVNALKDQNKGLADKLDALNKALNDNFLGLSADLDAVTGAIKMNYNMLSQIDLDLHADLQAIKDALDKIFGELVVLNTTTGKNGEQIVQALNANGEALTLTIDKNGELLRVCINENIEALIDALKDQNASLETKLDALGDIIKKGLGDIKVELGNLYGELKLDLGGLGDIIKEGFEGVTGGLTELKSEMNTDGTAIVNAITGKGDLIQGQIDTSGKLIEAAIKGNTTDLKTALEALGTSSQAVADKVDALNTTVNTGLGNIEAKINAQTGKIETGFTDLSGKLGTIGTNILNGFSGTHTDLEAIKAAINGLEDQLTIDINANTKAILQLDADFKAELEDLIEVGGNIVSAVNEQGEAIVLALGPNGSIVGAITAGTAEIVAAIEGQTTSLSAILNDANGGLPAILKALGTEDKDIKDILDFLKSKPNVDLSEIINLLGINNRLLTELLAISDGVYLDPEDKVGDNLYNYIYITADVRNAADNSDETAEALMSLLVGKSMAEPSKKQYCTTTPTTTDVNEHSHCFWKKVNEAKPYLKYTNVTTDVDNKSLLKMEKYYSESYWELKIHDVCSYAHIYSIQINDARDMDHYVQYYKSELTQNEAGNKANWNKGYVNEKVGTTYMGPLVVKFVSYDKATGEYCDSPNVRVYCQLSGTGQGSSKDISDKCMDGTPYPDGTYSENMPDDGYWTSKPWTSLTKVGDTPIATFDK